MSKAARIWLITAAVLTVLGGALITGAMAANNWDIKRLGTVKYINNTYEIGEDFKNISIDVKTSDIVLEKSADKKCRVEFYEAVKVKHTAEVKNGTLVISEKDRREWYDHLAFYSFERARMTLYLPKGVYEELSIDNVTGDFKSSADFTFGKISMNTVTGDIRLSNANAEKVDISVTTGNVELNEVNVKGDLSVKTTTGDVCFKDTVSSGLLSVNGTTGDIRFDNSDAEEISVSTTTGDITGTLRTEKDFSTDTNTGDVNVPDSDAGGECRLKTVTGDIEIKVE